MEHYKLKDRIYNNLDKTLIHKVDYKIYSSNMLAVIVIITIKVNKL